MSEKIIVGSRILVRTVHGDKWATVVKSPTNFYENFINLFAVKYDDSSPNLITHVNPKHVKEVRNESNET